MPPCGLNIFEIKLLGIRLIGPFHPALIISITSQHTDPSISVLKKLLGIFLFKRFTNSVRTRIRQKLIGSRLIEFHSQNKTVAASMIAEKKVSGQRSYRVATRRQSFRRPNMISMRLRRL